MQRLRAIDFFTVNLYWLSLSYFLNGLGRFIQPGLVLVLVPQEVVNTATGFLAAAGLAVATVVQPMMGTLSDRSTLRWGRRRPFILIGTLLDFVFLVAVGLSGNYFLLFVSILFLQFSTNTAHGAVQGLIPDLVPPEQRGKAVGVKQALEWLGLVITALVTAKLWDQAYAYFRQGDRGAALVPLFTAIGIIIAVLVVGLVLTLLLVKEKPRSEPVREPVLSTLLQTFQVDVQQHREFLLLLAGRIFILSGLSMVTNYALAFFALVLGLPNPAETLGQLLSIVAVLVLFISFPAGAVTDVWGRKPLNLLSGVVGAIGSLLFLFVTGRTVATIGNFEVSDILAYGSVLGIAIGIFLSANWTWATDLVPAQQPGKFLGLMNLANAGSGVISGLLGGPLIDIVNALIPGPDLRPGYNVAFVVGAASFLLGTFLMSRVRETAKKAIPRPEPAS